MAMVEQSKKDTMNAADFAEEFKTTPGRTPRIPETPEMPWTRPTRNADFFLESFFSSSFSFVVVGIPPRPLLETFFSSSFSPLFCGAPDKSLSKKLIETLVEKFGDENKYLCASFDTTSDKFNPKKYWRGPIWVNLNWIIYLGLKRYNETKLAERIKKDTIDLVSNLGFYEYFEPFKNKKMKGYGGNNFSWTAALCIDLINEKQ